MLRIVSRAEPRAVQSTHFNVFIFFCCFAALAQESHLGAEKHGQSVRAKVIEGTDQGTDAPRELLCTPV